MLPMNDFLQKYSLRGAFPRTHKSESVVAAPANIKSPSTSRYQTGLITAPKPKTGLGASKRALKFKKLAENLPESDQNNPGPQTGSLNISLELALVSPKWFLQQFPP